MSMSLEELNELIERETENRPDLRRKQLDFRASFVVAAALNEILEFRDQTTEQVAREAGIDAARLSSICSADSDAHITLVELAAVGRALNYQFSFQFTPKEVTTVTGPNQTLSVYGLAAEVHRGVNSPLPAIWSTDNGEKVS